MSNNRAASLSSDLLVRKGKATPSAVTNGEQAQADGDLREGETQENAAAASADEGPRYDVPLTAEPQVRPPEAELSYDAEDDEGRGYAKPLAGLAIVAAAFGGLAIIAAILFDGDNVGEAPVDGRFLAGGETGVLAPSDPPASTAAPDERGLPGDDVASIDVAPLEPLDGSAPVLVPDAASPVETAETGATDPDAAAPAEALPETTAAIEAPTDDLTGSAAGAEAASDELAALPPAQAGSEATAEASQLPPSASSPAGPFVAQLASMKSEQAALDAWARIEDQPAFADLGPHIMRVDIDGRGTFYRLRTGSFSTRGEATAFCRGIVEAGQACIPAER